VLGQGYRFGGCKTVCMSEEDKFCKYEVLAETSDVRRHGREWGILTLNVSS
jgi:hypothetical protein